MEARTVVRRQSRSEREAAAAALKNSNPDGPRFRVVRAKRKPGVLIQAELPWAGVDDRGFRSRIQRRRTLVAQVFGLADTRTGTPEFNPSFVDKVLLQIGKRQGDGCLVQLDLRRHRILCG